MHDLLRLVAHALVLVLVAVLATGCGAAAEEAIAEDTPKAKGGTITIGMDQEPQCLNSNIQCGSMAAARMITESIFDSMLTIDANGDFVPLLAEEVPTAENGMVVEKGAGMDVTIALNERAAWSDGTPMSCDDLEFSWKLRMDERWMIISRIGWDLITGIDCLDERTAVYHFAERYAPYLGIVGAAPLPKHVLDGKDYNTYFNDSISIASGPFMFEKWDRSVEVVLRRNERYWNKGADDRPWLDRIRYVFVADTNTLKIQLRTGEVDVISPPPDTSLQEELEGFPRGDHQVEPGVYWEQIAFNVSKPPLDDPRVRKAIAHSIDREQITETVLKGQVEVLNSTLLPAKEEFYLPTWEGVKPDPEKVAALLAEAGYEKAGTYFEKGGEPLTVTFKSTAGNALRLKVAQLLQQRLKASGIRMEIALEPPNVFFGESTPRGAYDMALWAWSSGVDPGQPTLFGCDSIPSEANEYSGQNYYRYCNERVSKLLKDVDRSTDAAERAKMVHEIQQLMAEDMPLLPIFQRPETLAYTDRMRGMDNNPIAGFVWNVADWGVVAK